MKKSGLFWHYRTSSENGSVAYHLTNIYYNKKMKTEKKINSEEQAYSFEVTTPALWAFAKDSGGEPSYASQERTPIAFYLREQMSSS